MRDKLPLLLALAAVLGSGPAAAQRSFPFNAEPRIYDFKMLPTQRGSIELSDYDADGDLDVLLTGRSGDFMVTQVYCQSRVVIAIPVGEVVVYDTLRTFIEAPTNMPPVWESTARWGDYDGDGDADVLLSGRTTLSTEGAQPITRLFEYRDGQYFADQRSEFVNVFGGDIAWGDYDGDADLDVLVTGSTQTRAPYLPSTRLYRNDGGIFTAVSTNLPDMAFGAAAWSDVDGDGDLDLALQGVAEAERYVTDVFRNEGGGQFERMHVDVQQVAHGSLDWGDVDGDGDDDLLVNGGVLDPHLQRGVTVILENDGGTFRRLDLQLPGTFSGAARFGDFDLDGRMDLAVSGAPRAFAQPIFSIYLNNGSGFNAAIPSFGLLMGDLAVGDYNEDGDTDVVVTGINAERNTFTNFYRNHMIQDIALGDLESPQIMPDLGGKWSGCVVRR